jgi:YD repeat-containing protein
MPGGCITRQSSGWADEVYLNGWYLDKRTGADVEYVFGNFNSNFDGSPDVFHYSYNGNSGKFFFDEENNIVVITISNDRIELIYDGDDSYPENALENCVDPFTNTILDGSKHFIGFRITSAEGTVYEFKQVEYSFPRGISGVELITKEGGIQANTWYLTKITSANGIDEITISYEKPATNKYQISAEYSLLQTKCQSFNFPYEHSTYTSYYNYNLNELVYISEISTNSGIKANFSISEKSDLEYPYQNRLLNFSVPQNCSYKGHKLDEIVINYNNVAKKRFYFSYTGNSTEKLKLLSLTEKSGNGVYSNPPYKFEYSQYTMGYDKDKVDKWGFYHNAFPFATEEVNIDEIDGRNPRNENYFDNKFRDLLKKIIYPTGGYSDFEYETNTYGRVAENPDRELKQLVEHPYYREFAEYSAINQGDPDPISLNINEGSHYYVKIVFHEDGTINTGDNWGNACYCDPVNCVFDVYFQQATSKTLNEIINIALQLSVNLDQDETVSCGSDRRNIYMPEEDGVPLEVFVHNYEYENSSFEYGGGVRVKSISNYDNITNKSTRKIYKYELEDGSTSSGIIAKDPIFKESSIISYVRSATASGTTQTSKTNGELTLNGGTPVSPLSMTGGSYISYSRVIEIEPENGKSIYHFTNFSDYPDTYSNTTIVSDQSHFRGKLLYTEQFKEGQNVPYRTMTYNYSRYTAPLPTGEISLYYGTLFKLHGRYTSSATMSSVSGIFYEYGPLSYNRTVLRLNSTTESLDGITKSTSFAYHDKLLSTVYYKSEQVGNQFISQTTRFVDDFDGAANSFISKMKENNILILPVEQITTGANFSATLYNYSDDDAKLGLVEEVFDLETTDAFTPVSFNDNFVSDLSNFDTRYHVNQANLVKSYNEFGKVVTISKREGNPISFLWGYNNLYIIAKIVKAMPDEILYESFEDYSSLTYLNSTAKTGRYSWSYPYNVVLPSPGTYLLTYWKKESGQPWEFVEQTISANTQIGNTSSTVIDEVRLYPPDALMTTYTYDPLVGVTSITDERNQTSYYVYDGLGRLQYIKDFEGNVLQRYEYNYAE